MSVPHQCGEGCGGGYQHVWIDEAEDGNQFQCHLRAARFLVCHRCVMLRNKRSDANHLRPQLFDEQDVIHQIVNRLAPGANHYARACLIAYVFEPQQAVQTVFP